MVHPPEKIDYFSFPHIDTLFIFLFLTLLCVILYSVSLQNDFLNDDIELIVKNPYIKHMSLTPLLFKTEAFYFAPWQTNYYRPLVMLSYAFDYQLWRLKPVGYHLTNILLHAVNALLVFLLMRFLFNDTPLAFASAALFCVHPVYSKVVAIIGNRGYILELLFSLLAIIALLSYLLHGKQVRYAASVILFIFALLCRESALLLPFFMILCGWMVAADKKKLLVSVLPFIIFGVAYGLLRSVVMPLKKLSLVEPISLQQAADFFYFSHRYIQQLIIMPYGSSLAFSHEKIAYAVSVVSSVCLYALLAKLIFAKDTKAIFGTLFFVLGSLSIVRLTDNIKYYGLVNFEGYIYFASIGFIVILAHLFAKLYARAPRVSSFLIVPVLLYYSGTTVMGTMYYKDRETFCKYILRFEKDNLFAHHTLGNVYSRKNMLVEAEKEFRRVLDINPNHWITYIALGDLYWKGNQTNMAMRSLGKAIAINPRAVAAYDLLGFCYLLQNKDQEAYDNFKKALRVNPRYVPALEDLAYLFMTKEQYGEALSEFEKILTLDPDNITAHIGVGIIAVKRGYLEKAEAMFLETLSIAPRSVDALVNLCRIYEKTGRIDDAQRIRQQLKDNTGH